MRMTCHKRLWLRVDVPGDQPEIRLAEAELQGHHGMLRSWELGDGAF